MASSGYDEAVDFVICGSGGGSMVAALYLKSIGKHPLILEKTDRIGGSTAMSGGVLWVPDHHLQAPAGVEDSAEAGLRYMEATIGDVGAPSSPARRQAFVREGARMVQWLEDRGMQWVRADRWADYYDDRPGGCTRSRSIGAQLLDSRKMGPLYAKLRRGPIMAPLLPDRIRWVTLAKRSLRGAFEAMKMLARIRLMTWRGAPILALGGALQGRMLMLAHAAGVDIRTDCKVVDLIEEEGRITGVVVDHDGHVRRIGARDGVLINAGGFARNPAMRERYGPKPALEGWTNANPGDTGEMIAIAERHGAVLDLMDQAWWVPGTRLDPGSPPLMHGTDLSKPHLIVVDKAGHRIMNESQSYMANGQAIYASGVPAFVITDIRHRNRYTWGGQRPGGIPPHWVESGFVRTAATLEELAAQCGIDPAGLAAEVAKFNGFCRTGRDLDFHRGERGYDNWFGDPRNRPNPNLGSIEQAPFLAFALYPGDVGTAGGVVADEHARVLRADGTAIPGLYATGNSTASLFGRCYPGAGASIGASFTFGWIAAHHAARSSGTAIPAEREAAPAA